MDILKKIKKNGDDSILTASELKEATRLISSELEACLQEYKDMQTKHSDKLKEFKTQSADLTRNWHKVKSELDHFVEECNFIEGLDGDLDDFQCIPFNKYQTEQLYLMALQCAASDDLETTKFEYEELDWTIRAYSRSFLESIVKLPECKEQARLYVLQYARLHSERLNALPQVAALFLSECTLLSEITKCEDIRSYGAFYIQQHLQALLEEIDDIMESGGAVYIDSQSIDHIVKRPFGQLLLQLGRFKSVLSECLDEGWLGDVRDRMLIVLARALCDALWCIIVNTMGGISKDCVTELNSVISHVIAFSDSVQPDDYTSREKLVSFKSLSQQTLLSCIGAFRKSTFKALTPHDYSALIRILFSDSSLRKSCLQEIEAHFDDEFGSESDDDNIFDDSDPE